MLEVLEQPGMKEFIAPITINHYHRMIKLGIFDDWDVELIDGVLVSKMSKSELHYFLVKYLEQQLKEHCPIDQFLIGKEDPITIQNSEPEPDLSVIKGRLQDFRHKKPTHAELVIEVAITSLTVDRAKKSAYAMAGIPEYWIVRPQDKITEVYRNPKNGTYAEEAIYQVDDLIEANSLAGFSFCLAEALSE